MTNNSCNDPILRAKLFRPPVASGFVFPLPFLFSFLILILLLCAPLLVWAEDPPTIELTSEEQDWLKAHPRIVFGAGASWSPYIIPQKDGSVNGIEGDLIQRINTLAGTNIQLKLGVWSEIQEKARNKEIDGLAVLTHQKEREQFFLFSDIVYQTHKYIFVKKGGQKNILEMSDLSGLRVGYQATNLAEEKILKREKGLIPVGAEDKIRLLNMLRNNEVDAVVGSINFQVIAIERMMHDIDIAFVVPEGALDIRYAVRKDWPILQSIINKSLNAISNRERLSILKKWGASGTTQVISVSSRDRLSDEEKAWLALEHIVRARVSYYPPLMFKEPAASGIAVDYMKVISERYGIKVEFIPDTVGFQVGMQDFMGERKIFDLFLTLKRTPEREQKIAFTDDYISMPWVIYSRNDMGFISGMEDLNGKTVSVEQGYVMADKIEEDYPSIRLLKVPTSLEALQAVATAEADAYIGNLSNATWLLREHGLDNLKIAAPTPFDAHDNAMGVRSDWPELASIISKGLASMSQEEHNAIKNRWLSVTYDTEVDYTLLWQILGAGGAIFFAIIYWNRSLRRKFEASTLDLSESEEKFRTLVENIPDVTWTTNRDGRTTFISDNIEILYGYRTEEILKTPELFFGRIHQDDAERVRHAFEAIFSKNETYDIEYRIQHKKGHWIWLHDRAITSYDKDGANYADGVFSEITARKKVERQIMEYQYRLKSLASQLTIAEEKERKRIATDLHDDVCQSLALLRMQVSKARKKASVPTLAAQLDDISETLLQTLQSTRHLMSDLSSPSMNEIGLSAAISELLEELVEKRHNLKTEFVDDTVDISRNVLEDNVRSILYRNVRELLTNIIKHAQAKKVSVRIQKVDKLLILTVRDDGVGFDPGEISKNKGQDSGFGLFSIKERMSDMNGTFEMVSAPGKGSKALLTVPIVAANLKP